MKNIFSKLLCVILASMLVLSCTSCTSCIKPDDNGGNEPPAVNPNHIYESTDTDKYVVKDGFTEYTLVYPSVRAGSEGSVMIDEFNYFFEMATGVALPKSVDTGLTHTAEGKYISLGDTTLLATSGIDIDKHKLGLDGTYITTKDNTIYIIGYTERGALNGVYTFMEYNFNYDCFTNEAYTIDQVKEFKLKNYNITDIPDFSERTIHSYYTKDQVAIDGYDNANFRYRMRLGSDHHRYIPIYNNYNKTGGTASGENGPISILNYATWKESHPKWFSTRSGSTARYAQVCYTAHGDAEEFEAMVQESVNKLKWQLAPENRMNSKIFQYAKTMILGIADNHNSCTCLACMDALDKYGSESGAYVVYANEVAKRMGEWQKSLDENDPCYVEDLTFQISAYIFTTKAPAIQDENGKWKPVAEEVKLEDNVAVEVAYIDTSFQRNPYEEDNGAFLDQVNAWQSLGGAGISYFMYTMNYLSLFYYYDTFNFYTTDIYRFMAATKPTHVIMDAFGSGTSLVTWNALKYYVDRHMYWNSSLDVEELIQKYMVGVYKDVAPQMMKIFNETRVYSIAMLERYGLNGTGSTCQKEHEKKEYYPLAYAEKMLAMHDEALRQAERYKDADPKAYSVMTRQIELEAVSFLVCKARLYYSELCEEDRNVLRDRLRYDTELFSLQQYKLDGFGNELLGTWVNTL